MEQADDLEADGDGTSDEADDGETGARGGATDSEEPPRKIRKRSVDATEGTESIYDHSTSEIETPCTFEIPTARNSPEMEPDTAPNSPDTDDVVKPETVSDADKKKEEDCVDQQSTANAKKAIFYECSNIVVNMDTQKTPHINHKILIKRYRKRNKNFVPSEGYEEAKRILHKKHIVMITGFPGSGKSTVAIQLLLDYTETHTVVKLHSILEWDDELHSRSENQIVLLDDVFGKSNYNKNNLEVVESRIEHLVNLHLHDENILVVMCSQTSFLKEAQSYMKKLDLTSTVVDLSEKFKLSNETKKAIFRKYVAHNKVTKKIEDIHGTKFAENVSKVDCPLGFPHCVVMFTNPEHDLIRKGLDFFKCPFEHCLEVLRRLQQVNPCLYGFMLLLAFRDGSVLEEDLEFELSNPPFKSLLENTLGSIETFTVDKIKEVFQKYDGVYLKRFVEEGITGFHHYIFKEAISILFANKYKKETIEHFSFEFSFQTFKIGQDNKDKRVVVLEEKEYRYLAEKFANEILRGNIQTICQHQACRDQRFTKELMIFLDKHHQNFLQTASPSPFYLMERELEIRETFNGSLLYWASVYGSEALCAAILDYEAMKDCQDKLWIKLQSSAALVHACFNGFACPTITGLLDLGADALCQHQLRKEYVIKFCDFCNVYDGLGINPLQAVLQSKKLITYQESLLKIFLDKITDDDRNKQENKIIIGKAFREAIINNNTAAANRLVSYSMVDMEYENNGNNTDQMSCLWHAVCHQNITLVNMLLPNGNINETDNFGATLLMKAKNLDIIKVLIQKGVSVNAKDNNGRTVLFFAHDDEIASYLIEIGKLNVNETDDKKMTPLHYVAQEHDSSKTKIVNTLLMHDADLFVEDLENRFPLDLVQRSEISEIICRDLKLRAAYDSAKVMASSLKNVQEVDVLKSISKHLRNLPYDPSEDLQIAFLYHAKKGTLSLKLLNFFEDEHVDINVSDGNGSILHYLCEFCQRKNLKGILKKLKSRNLDTNNEDKNGNTPLHVACLFSQTSFTMRKEIIRFLIDNRADVNARNRKGETPLHLLFQTVCEGTSGILDILIDRVADINVQSHVGLTPLHFLSSFDTISLLHKREARDCAAKLIKHGTYIASCNINCHVSPLLCSSRTNLGMFQVLVENVKNVHAMEILQILDFHVTAPGDMNSWKVIKILKQNNIIQTKLSPDMSTHESRMSEPIILTQHMLDDICERTKMNSDVVLMMLNPSDVKRQEKIEKYFYYGMKFGSKLNINIHHTDRNGRNYLTLLIIRIDETKNKMKSELTSHEEMSDLDIIRFLLEKHIDVNHKDLLGHTPLHYAISSGESDENVNEIVKLLIANGADISKGNPILLAATSKMPRTKVLETLIHSHAIKNECDKEGRNALFLLVQTYIKHFRLLGDISTSVRFLAHRGVDVNKKNRNNETVLHHAVKCFTSFDSAHRLFKSAFVHALLECESDPNVIDENSGQTTLHKAVMYNNYRETDLLKLLISKGGKATAVDNNKRGLLHCAVHRMNHDSVKTVLYLLSINLDVNLQDGEGNTPLHTLVQKSCPMVQVSRPEVDLEVDHVWCGPLRISVMKCLLMHKADVNITNNSGKTVLHFLVEQYRKYQDYKNCDPKHILIEMLSMLLSNGSKTDIKDNRGKSAVDYASEWSLAELRKCLTSECSPEELLFQKYKWEEMEVD